MCWRIANLVVSLRLSLIQSQSHSVSASVSLSLSLTQSQSHSVSVSLSPSLTQPQSHSVPVSRSPSLTRSQSDSVSVSVSLRFQSQSVSGSLTQSQRPSLISGTSAIWPELSSGRAQKCLEYSRPEMIVFHLQKRLKICALPSSLRRFADPTGASRVDGMGLQHIR